MLLNYPKMTKLWRHHMDKSNLGVKRWIHLRNASAFHSTQANYCEPGDWAEDNAILKRNCDICVFPCILLEWLRHLKLFHSSFFEVITTDDNSA
ncbi:hypothetical protein CRM22_002567 [Opisthorchis felineus]|uniref:Uncharacterized protein n=1 Tax=Opisthorchis felineus TaxID=147828 RepID=A0A4S2MBP3_OPIFE|nr:hypothetical protein CRM22_002567 [Opisthorchis felineus]